MKKILILFSLILIFTASCVFASQFIDMSESHWAYSNVILMQEKGVINGFEDGTFRPDAKVTREQFAKMLVKTFNLTNVNNSIKFEDVDDSRWSANDISIASNYLAGYTSGETFYFKPEEESVREDVAVAVVKACGLENSTPNYDLLNIFSDKDIISENLKGYIAIAVENGIMKGNADGTFNPLGKLTRAESVTLLSNVLNMQKNDSENTTANNNNNSENIEVSKITLDNTTLQIKEGESKTLIATIKPSNATNQTITWTSSKPSVVSVENGVITGLAVNKSSTITATTSNGKKATCKVTVECDHYYSDEPTEYTNITSDTHTEIFPCENCLDSRYNKEEVVSHTYDNNDKCKCGYVKGTIINVNVSKITLDKKSLTLKKDESVQLVATISPSDATDQTITWKSSDPSVVSVEKGVVTGLKVNKSATITATTNNGKKATCKVTVECDHLTYDTFYKDIDYNTHDKYIACVDCLKAKSSKDHNIEEHKFDSEGVCECGYKKDTLIDEDMEKFELLSSIDIMTGFPDGKFMPNDNITNAEATKIITSLMALDLAGKASMGVTTFQDVPSNHWASGYINVAKEYGFSYTNGNYYYPDSKISNRNFVTMVVKALGYNNEVKNGDYVSYAKSLKLLKDVDNFNADDNLTRVNALRILYRALDTQMWERKGSSGDTVLWGKTEKTLYEIKFDLL